MQNYRIISAHLVSMMLCQWRTNLTKTIDALSPAHLVYLLPPRQLHIEKIREKSQFVKKPRTNKAVLDTHRGDKASLMLMFNG
jgi:hypothetical protein